MEIKSYTYQISRKKTWDEVFRNPVNVEVTSLQTGTVKLNLKGTLNPKLADVENEELQVPILNHWVKHEHKGDILLDAGLDASYIYDPKGGLHGPAVDEFQLDLKKNIGYHIQKNKIILKMVFLSHLHADHAAGVRELPRNIPYIVGKGEYQEYKPELHGNFLEGLDTLFEIYFSHAQEMPYLGRCVDLLGDGTLWAIWTPGHTPGHMSFLINRLEGPVLLAMDAAFIHRNLELGVAPSDYTWDVEQAQESLDKIIEFLEQYPQVRVGAGHEAFK
jgi:glyoxylase-like metal-dependent hydrolase (beta-lactamase superfamily II)